MRQQFGGGWTEVKLKAIRDYFVPYLKILHSHNLRANYLDGFAGSGRRYSQVQEGQLSEFTEPEAGEFSKGSPRIALGIEPPFDEYIFVDTNEEYVAELRKLASEHPTRKVQVVQDDSNRFIRRWIPSLGTYDRALVFLDPYGMQVEWATVQLIAASKKVDLWLLVPLGQAVIRLMPGKELPKGWSEALTKFFGTDEWKSHFYPIVTTDTLFGPEEVTIREVDYARITSYFVSRLKSVFADAIDSPIVLRNSKGVPLYLLCFAVGNPVGAPTAIKIAKHIARKFNDGR